MNVDEIKIEESFPTIVKEELHLHNSVRLAVRKAALKKQPDMGQVNRDLVELRDEARHAHERDLPSLFQALTVHHSLAGRDFKVKLPDLRTPYFAHMRLQEDGKIKDILIGHMTFIDTELGVTIIDWKNAPVAKIFFNYSEGDFYSEQLPGKLAEGQVLARRVVTFYKGELLGIQTPDNRFQKRDESWVSAAALEDIELQGGQGTADRGNHLGTGLAGRPVPDVSALLDRRQFELLNRDDDEPLLILGGAGCGKTTVALHRMAALAAKKPNKFRQEKMLVVVPETGLVRLSQKLLKSLDLGRVRVSSYDEWIAYQGRHLLRCLPSRIYSETPARVVRLKRHPALPEVFKDLELKRIDSFCRQIERELAFDPEAAEKFRQTPGRCLLDKINNAKVAMIKEVEDRGDANSSGERKKTEACFKSLARQLYNLDIDRRTLFTDANILERVVEYSNGSLDKSIVPEVIRHSHFQFAEPDDVSNLAQGNKAVMTLDGMDISDEPIEELAGSIDVEDYSLMFELLRVYTNALATADGKFLRYSHMVIDEAQELAPLELTMLGNGLDAEASVTIAGDSAQQTDPNTTFSTWENVLAQLGYSEVEASHLQTNYRSPAPIAKFAHQVLGSFAPSQEPPTVRGGVPVKFSEFSDEGLSAITISEALEGLVQRENRASVAIICRDYESCVDVYRMLKDRLPRARFVPNGEFNFEPGIDITEISQIKGLEFDYVVLPDVNIQNYPDTAKARRNLHVAATRAMHQLWVISQGLPSPILHTDCSGASSPQ